MTDATTPYHRMMRVARRISSSSVGRVLLAHVAPCILDLLGHARPRRHRAVASII
jgi:hypothetical protein